MACSQLVRRRSPCGSASRRWAAPLSCSQRCSRAASGSSRARRRQACQRAAQASWSSVLSAANCAASEPQGHAGQQRALPIGVRRAVERLQQLLQFGDLGAGPDAALAERDRLDAGGPQGFQHPAGLAVAAHQHGDMPRAQRRAVEPVALRGVQAPRDVLGQLAQQPCADLGLRALAPGPQLQGGARLRFFERRLWACCRPAPAGRPDRAAGRPWAGARTGR
jgi:hypothetical protein